MTIIRDNIIIDFISWSLQKNRNWLNSLCGMIVILKQIYLLSNSVIPVDTNTHIGN